MSVSLRSLNRIYTITELVESIFDIFNFSRPKCRYMESFRGLIIVCFVNLCCSPMTPWSLTAATVFVGQQSRFGI